MADDPPKKKAPIDYSSVRVLTDADAEKVDAEAKRLSEMIRRVRRQYDLWFYGTESKPPHELRNELDRVVRRMRNKLPKRTADQFKMATVFQQYQSLVELWDKTQRKLEEGGLAPWTSQSHKNPLLDLQEAAENRGDQAREAARKKKASYVARVSSAEGSDAEFRKVYDSYCAARKEQGDKGGPDFDKFKATLAKQTKSLIGSGKATAVAYRVEVQDGKVSIKAKAEKD